LQYRVRGERRSIRELLELFPFEQLSNELQCRLAFNWVETGEPERGERTLNQLADSGQIHSVGLASLAVLAHRRGDHTEQLRLALEARKIQALHDPPGAVASQVIDALLGLGRLEEALTEAQAFVQWAETSKELGQLVTALSFLSYALEQQHQFEAQRQTLLRALEICGQLNWPNRAATLQIDLAKLEAMRGEFATAEEILQVARVSIEITDGFAIAVLEQACGLVADWSGVPNRAKEYFERGLRAAEVARASVVSQRLRFHLADLSLRMGSVQSSTVQSDAGLNGHHLSFIQALRNHRDGQFEITLEQLEALQRLPLEPHLSVRVRAIQADCLEHLGRDSSAIRTELVGWDGMVETRILPLEQMEITSKNPLVQTLDSVPTLEPANPQMVLTTLGEFRAEINGIRVPIHLTKSAELLAWLAIHRSGTREVIVEALWGTNAEERHYEYFRVAVRRLRVALSAAYPGFSNPLPIELGRYQLADELKIQTDLPSGSQTDPPLEMLETEFVRLNQSFLPESEAEWIELLREQIRERAVDLGLYLARQQTRATEAIVRYQQVLKLDPMSDKANQGLIEQHYQVGAVGAAQKALEQYERVLHQELGLTPMEDFLEQMRVWGLKPQAI
jgi:LuxR family transcriptional regulator, maltose regulon positive regulatory protein